MEPSRWSKLPSDLMQLVFERLGFADFQRAKSVCSPWRYASKRSSPNNQTPWLILIPEKGKDHCLLFDPEENEEKLYRIKNLGVNFANSNCLATYGSWLLMQDDHQYNILYVLNIFTCEKIDLPSMKSQLSIVETEDDMFLVKLDNNRDVLIWFDEKTKDYVVIWIIQPRFLVYSRKGDKFWKQIELFNFNDDMVYKDHNLYLYSWSRDVKVLDFSQDIPRQVFETQVKYDYSSKPEDVFYYDAPDTRVWKIKTENLVVRVTGEVLRVKSIVLGNSDAWSFRIYKMDSSNSKWEKLDSLGDEEAIFLDLGITVRLANTSQGVNGNSIYFSGNHNNYCDSDLGRFWSEKDILIFNLGTQEIEIPHPSIFSSVQLSNARWFVPNFKQM
ncbi:F-box domain-containing protein [Hirschfeldia incana]|nr:F-box domain-containing protein [Hirschfeldia incana]